ncbi:MAG: phosphate acyltransferase PlsX [Ruminococcaceae bacterium]|nr:phosphate acyltransferase PlsX [Oscillospiraceae bacterium]
MKIIIDAMGGDYAPQAPVAGGIKAVQDGLCEVIFVGKEELIQKELEQYTYPKEKVSIVPANDVISNHEEPALAVRRKKDASVVVAANLLKEGKADAMLSMGSTGALLTAALLIVGRIPGIKRPALATMLPTGNGGKLLLDTGANTNCKPETLVQFAWMGHFYMKYLQGVAEPEIGLLNNGAEAEKGDTLHKETYPLLAAQKFRFIGNIEGHDAMRGKADVIVADGFSGNIFLKTAEGVAGIMSRFIKEAFKANLLSMLAGILVKKQIYKIKSKMDYREYGGAPFLGVKKPVIKGHGSSDEKAVYSAVRQAVRFAESDLIQKIQNEANTLLKGGEEDGI